MPISRSAKKALRVSRRKNLTNRKRKLIIKAALKEVSGETVGRAFSLIDKAVKWRIFHANKAARLKSQLSKKFAVVEEKPRSKTAKTERKKPVSAKKAVKSKRAASKK